eukprot:Gb_26897 [translate_table: standard]
MSHLRYSPQMKQQHLEQWMKTPREQMPEKREVKMQHSRTVEPKSSREHADKAETIGDSTAKQRHTKEQSWNERHTYYREGGKILKTPLKIKFVFPLKSCNVIMLCVNYL